MLTKVDQNITKNLTILFLVVCLRAFQGCTQKKRYREQCWRKIQNIAFFLFFQNTAFFTQNCFPKTNGNDFFISVVSCGPCKQSKLIKRFKIAKT